jgi:hypothetical protein
MLPKQTARYQIPLNLTHKLTKIKAQVQQQLRTTVGSVKQIRDKVFSVKKTRNWWNKKSMDTWRPSRRRLDLDSLRITVKQAPLGRSNVGIKPSKFREPYYRTLQKRYSLKKEQSLNSDTLQNDRKKFEKNWRSLTRSNLLSFSSENSNTQRSLKYGNIGAIELQGLQSELVRLKQKENESGSRRLASFEGQNWIDNVEKNRFMSQRNTQRGFLETVLRSHSFLQRQFKRKRVSRRRGRKLVAAGYSRRPNLSALIKRSNQNNSIDQNSVFEENNVISPFLPQKSPHYRKRKHREWDRKVKPDNGIKTNKYRKRRMTFYGKLRSAQKELIRVRWKLQVQKWWWQYMPSLQNTVKSNLITLAHNDQNNTCIIRNTDKKVTTLLSNNERSSRGNTRDDTSRDLKPFGLPEALRSRRDVSSCPPLCAGRTVLRSAEVNSSNQGEPEKTHDPAFLSNLTRNALNTIRVSNSLNIIENAKSLSYEVLANKSSKLQIINAVPFYAGWDESMRKFVITNILFSLRDATYEIKNISTLIPGNTQRNVVFTEAPLRGQNGATTVYWQTPFSTYETDQFFTLGVDGFSPLQWSRFNFSQSIVKNWSALRTTPKVLSPILVKAFYGHGSTKSRSVAGTLQESSQGSDGNQKHGKNPAFGKVQPSAILSSEARRRQKRYKRVRRHPRAPIWYPSGSLISDVLPTQYIYAFDSTARRPRDRYMQRRWRKRSQLLSNEVKQQSRGTTDFTLRRRPNGRRKYHRRGGKLRSLLTVAYPKRRKFIGSPTNELRWRPERSEKDSNYTIKLEEVRKRRGMALRRRKLRQVFPVIRRFKTLNGGFVWPGTYLLLEQRNVPKMHVTANDIKKASFERKSLRSRKKQRRKIKRKTRDIAQWNIQPKKYLLQKHNQKVIKKKLQKAYRTHNLAQKLEQLKKRVHTVS